MPVVFTIHNMGYQGVFPREVLERVGVAGSEFRMDGLEFFGQGELSEGRLALFRLSDDGEPEICGGNSDAGIWPRAGRGGARARRPAGGHSQWRRTITVWNPESDPLIAAHYSAKDLAGKQVCKRICWRNFICRTTIWVARWWELFRGLPIRRASICWRSRRGVLLEDLAMVALGTGEAKYEKMFLDLARALPGTRRREDRLRQYAGAQDRGRRGHVSDAVAVRALRLEPDLQSCDTVRCRWCAPPAGWTIPSSL